MKPNLHKNQGFTKKETTLLLLIITTLFILIQPQFSTTQTQTQKAILGTDLKFIRTAIKQYHQDHNSTYPGHNNTDGTPATPDQMEEAFTLQMTQYTNKNGETSTRKHPEKYPFGPYIQNKKIPKNPLPNPTTPPQNQAKIQSDNSPDTPLKATKNAQKGWRYSTKTGQFIPNNPKYQSM